jgi:hypothetical protein
VIILYLKIWQNFGPFSSLKKAFEYVNIRFFRLKVLHKFAKRKKSTHLNMVRKETKVSQKSVVMKLQVPFVDREQSVLCIYSL